MPLQGHYTDITKQRTLPHPRRAAGPQPQGGHFREAAPGSAARPGVVGTPRADRHGHPARCRRPAPRHTAGAAEITGHRWARPGARPNCRALGRHRRIARGDAAHVPSDPPRRCGAIEWPRPGRGARRVRAPAISVSFRPVTRRTPEAGASRRGAGDRSGAAIGSGRRSRRCEPPRSPTSRRCAWPGRGCLGRRRKSGRPGRGCLVRRRKSGRPGRGCLVRRRKSGRPGRGCLVRRRKSGRPGRGCLAWRRKSGRPGRGCLVRRRKRGRPGRGCLGHAPGCAAGDLSDARPGTGGRAARDREVRARSGDRPARGSTGARGHRNMGARAAGCCAGRRNAAAENRALLSGAETRRPKIGSRCRAPKRGGRKSSAAVRRRNASDRSPRAAAGQVHCVCALRRSRTVIRSSQLGATSPCRASPVPAEARGGGMPRGFLRRPMVAVQGRSKPGVLARYAAALEPCTFLPFGS
jgi:hypothetical protein